jgi:hypothetical protein
MSTTVQLLGNHLIRNLINTVIIFLRIYQSNNQAAPLRKIVKKMSDVTFSHF